MVDAGRVRSLLDRLSAAHRDLRRLRSMDREVVGGDVDRLNSVKYLFVVAAEISIDVGNHIIAAESLRAPESFSDVFAVLAESSWLDEDLAGQLAEMARFPNLLVHGYARVDDERVLDILHSSLDDLAAYTAAIGASLSSEESR